MEPERNWNINLEYKVDIKWILDAATDSGSWKPRIYGARTKLENKLEYKLGR